MYFPVLQKLKDSKQLSVETMRLFDALLFLIYDKGYHKRFTPRVYRYFGIPVDESDWIYALEQLNESDAIKIKYELCCPFYDETIGVFEKYDDLPIGEDKICKNCGESFTVTAEDILLTYSFNETFVPQKDQEGDEPFFRGRRTKRSPKSKIYSC